ncbi:unnamed protein product, partial [Amoebophrya sp. A25]|eukprot:GSA25T00004995001.1
MFSNLLKDLQLYSASFRYLLKAEHRRKRILNKASRAGLKNLCGAIAIDTRTRSGRNLNPNRGQPRESDSEADVQHATTEEDKRSVYLALRHVLSPAPQVVSN